MHRVTPTRSSACPPTAGFAWPWAGRGVEPADAFRHWRRDLPACFRDARQRTWMAGHAAAVTLAPPAPKRVIDSYVWRHTLAGVLGGADEVLELLPGASLTIPLALQSLGFRGHLRRADVTALAALADGFGFTSAWQPGDVLTGGCDPAGVVVGNHVLDDLIAADQLGASDYYGRIYGHPAEERTAWAAVARSSTLADTIRRVVALVCRLAEQARVLVLREYPASVAIAHANVAHVAVHAACYAAVVTGCRQLNGATVWHPTPAGNEVPRGCRHRRSVLVVSCDSAIRHPRQG